MTATYDLATDIGKVRLYINDKDVTPATDAHFTDEELQVFLDNNDDDIYLAAADALEAWAAALTSNVTSEHIGDYSYSKKDVDNKLTLAGKYREASSNAPVLDWAEMNLVDLPETIEED